MSCALRELPPMTYAIELSPADLATLPSCPAPVTFVGRDTNAPGGVLRLCERHAAQFLGSLLRGLNHPPEVV